MSCVLCLEVNENSFNFNDPEGINLNARQILEKHFVFCFDTEGQSDIVCEKCWLKVEIFHNFYQQIECIHRPTDSDACEKIFVQNLKDLPIDYVPIVEESDVAIVEVIPPNSPVKPAPANQKNVERLSEQKKEIPAEEVKMRKPAPKLKAPPAQAKTNSSVNKCDICGDRFQTAYRLKNHIRETHVKLEFKCTKDDCNESFVSKLTLTRHLKDKHTTVKCEHCKKDVRKSYIKKHIRSVHSLEDQTMCHLCGKVSNTKEAHNIHYITEHSDQNGVQCDICKTWYKNKLTIRMHFLYRHKQSPVICPVCGKQSPNKKALTVHKRIHREDYKERFKCPICEKGFRDRTKLREHSYSHSGISDAYKCNHCERTFRYGSDLSKHRKKQHPVEENLRKTSNYQGSI